MIQPHRASRMVRISFSLAPPARHVVLFSSEPDAGPLFREVMAGRLHCHRSPPLSQRDAAHTRAKSI